MLPDIHLDQITFEEMLEKAKNKIASCYPEWTDFNYHDPGITLVELFAWLKEIQQYELNHVGDAHRRKYLNLLGTDTLHRSGAKTFVCVGAAEPIRIPAGSRLIAQGVPFETKETQMLPGVSLQCGFGFYDRKVSYLDQEQLSLGHTLEFYPFGREALEGTCLYLGFADPLPVDEMLCLTVWTGGSAAYPRNPAEPDTIPLAEMACSFWNGSSYQPLEIVKDETFGFLFDGQLVFRLREAMQERTVDGEQGYFLRFQLTMSQYEMPPVLRFLDINTMKVQQRETVAVWLEAEKDTGQEPILTVTHGLCMDGRIQVFFCQEDCYREVAAEEVFPGEQNGQVHIRVKLPEEDFQKGNFRVLVSEWDDWYLQHQILGTGRGFPGESFTLDETCVLLSELELLVEEPENPGIFRKWEMRVDFAHSGPEDRHYCVDSMTGNILFGDCINGMAPEGRILLASYTRVLGSYGNVKERKIDQFADDVFAELPVTNPQGAAGGRDEESYTEAFARVRTALQTPRNMVTAEDYEQAVLATPGLRIESCKALAGTTEPGGVENGQVMQLVVKPCSLEKRPKLKPAVARNIKNYLEPKRMLGVEIRILSPMYGKVFVYLEVLTRPQYQEAQELIEQAIEEYLSPYLRQFGRSISYSGLYGHIDRLSCVAGVHSLLLDAKGNGIRKNTYGDLLFPGNGIVDEIEIQCSCSVAV